MPLAPSLRSSHAAISAPAQRAPALQHCQRRPPAHLTQRAPRPAASATDPSTAAQGAVPAARQLTSLKEWAPTVAAIGEGDQTVLLRKGGIREPTFRPAAREFLLFPTAFHTDAQLLKPAAAAKYAQAMRLDPKAQPQLEFSVFARVTGGWTTFDPRALELLDGLHIWTPAFLEARLRWRERQPITVLELRAYRLHEPLSVPTEESFWGCFSWVDLPTLGALPLDEAELRRLATPALSDEAFAARQAECRRQLSQIDVQELQLP